MNRKYWCNIVESRKFKILGTRDFISREINLNYREVDIRIYNAPKTIRLFPIKHVLCA